MEPGTRGSWRNAPRPWFVWIHYRETHGPWRARRHPDAAPPLDAGPGERLRVLPTAFGRGGIPSYQALPGLFTRESYEARYRDEIRYVDAQLSRLLDQIDIEEPLPGVLATADHGQAFGEDLFYFSHGHSVGLDQIRVPLLWRPPAGGTPERIEAPVSTLDAAPTLLRAAGLATPSRFEGRPLPSASDAPGAPQLARSIFAEAEGTVAVVSGSHYYSRDRDPGLPIDPSLQSDDGSSCRISPCAKYHKYNKNQYFQ